MSDLLEKNRYNEQELQEFKELIEGKIEKANKELAFYLEQMDELNESSEARLKSLDDGTNAAEAERVATMIQRQQKLVQHLEQALVRIKNGVYGVCSVTGTLIPKERLLLVPHATKSIEGKLTAN